QAVWNVLKDLPEDLSYKGYLDTLHVMQGSGADVVRRNAASSTELGVGAGFGTATANAARSMILARSGSKVMQNSHLGRDELISGLPAGTKITPESVVDIRKLPDGRTVWLETGSDAAGLQHIYKRHEVDFFNKGVLRDEIPTVVMSALE